MPSHSESRFWDKYIYKTTSYNIKPEVARRYVRHAEAYIKAHNRRLASHSPNDVVKYLTAKGRISSLHDWQFRQIVTSIKGNMKGNMGSWNTGSQEYGVLSFVIPQIC